MSAKKQMKEAIKACQAAGLAYDPQRTHPRITDPKTGRFVTLSNTPSCPHAHKNLLSDVRKYLNIAVTL